MVHTTATTVAAATAVALVVHWTSVQERRAIRTDLHSAWTCLQNAIQTVYRNYRSECSRLIGLLLCSSRTFECDCCCLRLGQQDLDWLYHRSCYCGSATRDAEMSCCYHCVRADIDAQVAGNQVTQPRCMRTRRCALDDRLVRKRLSAAGICILDRNQVIEASTPSATSTGSRSDRLWRCPSPDCTFMGFISSFTSPDPERQSVWRSVGRFLTTFKTLQQQDPRRVRCPHCFVSSCQFCSRAWTRQTADHTGIACDAYAAQVDAVWIHQSAALDVWKTRHGVQSCRRCHAAIEKNMGCKHMTCRCGFEFCWTCGEKWEHGHMNVSCQRIDTPNTSSAVQSTNDERHGLFTWMINWLRA